MASLLGNLFILAAPSGAGKSSLIKALLEKHDGCADYPLQVSVSHTTRQPRPGEVDGIHYHFVSREQFETLIEQGVFFEYAEVFGNYYGTSRVTIEQTLHRGVDVFLDIDWQGARQVKKILPDACSIFILPPSVATLRERLSKRGQDSAEVIESRMNEAVAEMSHFGEFDYILINDDFSTALSELEALVCAQRLRTQKQALRNVDLLSQLVGSRES
ncbi:guanylate kinase [Alteromonas sp. ASW11-130]|uniref:guanylate kinase n=1 Tax=Alteromonas sp. ASW11-130 TaxID=3015775 RepID=UPI00224267B6|nr:guanylate kinase [Alteromonas sp. ASW11-130]MCW8091109.1 guanylate kinase [Alteromonas sp. ASW11-130]